MRYILYYRRRLKMTAPYKNVTVAISDADHKVLTNKLAYGQLSQLVKLFLSNIVDDINRDNQSYLNWLYKSEPYTLKNKKDI